MHSQKLHLPLLLLASVLLLSGCVTHYSYPDKQERTEISLRHLYFDSRTLGETNGVIRYVLIQDTGYVAAVEAILLHYSLQPDVDLRRIAGSYLAKFGTDRAFARAMEIAQSDPDPRTRAELWESLAEFLFDPQCNPELTINTNEPTSTYSGLSTVTLIDTNASTPARSVLSTPVILLPIWHMTDALLPPGVTAETIESAIISQYRTDDGFWEQTFIDRIPFVPFSGRQHTERITVRQRIAQSIYVSCCSGTLIDAFRQFSLDPDPAISEFAKPVVREWERKNVTPCSPIQIP